MMRKLYALFGLLIIAGYTYAGFTGGELGTKKKGYAPPGSRGSQGSRAFWYGGYRGGK